MRTITVENNVHWKALQIHGDRLRCDVCDKSHAINCVRWFDHPDTLLFELRYCNTCLPEILNEPPIDVRVRRARGR